MEWWNIGIVEYWVKITTTSNPKDWHFFYSNHIFYLLHYYSIIPLFQNSISAFPITLFPHLPLGSKGRWFLAI